MLLTEVANEYASLNTYNSHTKEMLHRVARLFTERSKIKSLLDINLESLVEYRNHMNRLNLAPATFNGYLGHLRVLGKYASDQGYLSENWFKRLGPMPEPRRNMSSKAMSNTEIKKVVAWIQSHPDAVKPTWFWLIVLKFIYYHGLRRRQLYELKISDLDTSNQLVLLRYEGSKTKREWTVPLHSACKDDIKTLLSNYCNPRPTDQLFNVTKFHHRYKPDSNGNMRSEHITGAFKKIGELSGVRIGAQRLRHTTATIMCNPESGEVPDLFSAQYMLGHTMLSTTRGYVKQNLRNVRFATEKIQPI